MFNITSKIRLKMKLKHIWCLFSS